MKWRWRIFWGFIGVFTIDQTLVTLSQNDLVRPEAVAGYIAEADWRVLSDEEVLANKEGNARLETNPSFFLDKSYQTCRYVRSKFLYYGYICYKRIREIDQTKTSIHYWAPVSFFNPYDGETIGESEGLDAYWRFNRAGEIYEENLNA